MSSNGEKQEAELELQDLKEIVDDIQAYADYAGIQKFRDKGVRTQVLYLVINYLTTTGATIAQCIKCGADYQQPETGNQLCISCYMEERNKVSVT